MLYQPDMYTGVANNVILATQAPGDLGAHKRHKCKCPERLRDVNVYHLTNQGTQHHTDAAYYMTSQLNHSSFLYLDRTRRHWV